MNTHFYTKTCLSAIACLISASAYCATITSTESGSWSDPATWGGAAPTETDSVRIGGKTEVTLTGQASIVSIEMNGNGQATGSKLIVTGSGASLTLSSTETKLWYNNVLQIDILDGATFTAPNLSWGGGGSYNINVIDSTFNGNFSQLQGSLNSNPNYGNLVFKNSTANMSGGLGISPTAANQNIKVLADNTKMTIANGITVAGGTNSNASFKITNGTNVNLAAGSTLINAAGVGAKATLEISGGSYLRYGNSLHVAYVAGASNKMLIFGKGTFVSTTGAGTISVGSIGAKAENSEASITFGGFDENGKFQAAEANALKGTWEVLIRETGSLNYLLGASNASETVDRTKVIFSGSYFKAVTGLINVDLSNVSGLAEGEYYFALFTSTSNQSIGSYEDYADILNVTDGEFAKFQDYFIKDSTFYIIANVIPEPSTYAVIAGSLALALAFYRRKK